MTTEIDLTPLQEIDGFVAAALIDAETGFTLITLGDEMMNLERAAADNTQVFLAKKHLLGFLDPNERIEDMIFTLERRYHLLRPLGEHDEICLYLVLDRGLANLAMARRALKIFESELQYG